MEYGLQLYSIRDLTEKDFEGAEFSILTTTWYNAKTYIYADELNGEIINARLNGFLLHQLTESAEALITDIIYNAVQPAFILPDVVNLNIYRLVCSERYHMLNDMLLVVLVNDGIPMLGWDY